MAKKSQALIAAEAQVAELKERVAELEGRNAALEARITLAIGVYKNQKARIAELEAQLNARGAAKVIAVKPQPVRVVAEPVVTTFTRRDGVVCERVRTGNRAVVREVRRTAMHGVEVSYQ